MDALRCHEARSEEFEPLRASVETALYKYILCLVPNWTSAEDILQETYLRLWKDFDRYQPGTSFLAWAVSIAHYQVLTHRKNQQRSRLRFSPELVDELVEVWHEVSRNDVASDALRVCIDHLRPRSRELLRRCYGQAESVKDIAANSSLSQHAVYKALSRIRQTLRKCIEESL